MLHGHHQSMYRNFAQMYFEFINGRKVWPECIYCQKLFVYILISMRALQKDAQSGYDTRKIDCNNNNNKLIRELNTKWIMANDVCMCAKYTKKSFGKQVFIMNYGFHIRFPIDSTTLRH